MSQCQECRKQKRSWEVCPCVPQWFNPSEIYYCPHQVEWILTNLSMLKSGRWPPESIDTNYYDTGGKKLRRSGAYFEVPIAVASDIELRLEKCDKDGRIVRQCICNGWDEVTLALIMGKPVYIIRAKIQRVLSYCSGYRKKRITYHEFSRRWGISEYRRRDLYVMESN